ncbi:MAG: thiaminase II [Leptospiraceae bacterium]|nr:thiaminase II [Leptospiraceae bacterium]MDW8306678.1 thiaminase II [Leptospiraceae bacterium]
MKTSYHIPPFAQRCRQAADQAWKASFEHPFVRELAKGTLDKQKFRFYQMHDARYLEAFADATSLIAVRCRQPKDKLWFIEAARLALVVEGELHAGYGKTLGYNEKDIAELELTLNNAAYQNHMVATAQRGSLLEAVAAITPCPWLYIDLGQHLLQELKTIPDDHPYANWLRMYSNPQFNDYMENLLERLQRFSEESDASTCQRAVEAFVMSARYEYLFWEAAYTNQKWPV